MLFSNPIEIKILSDTGVDWIGLLAIMIPSVISIIGFVVSTKINKKSINSELEKFKNTISVEKSQETLDLLVRSLPSNSQNKLNQSELIKIQNNILAYGSFDMNKLFEEYQHFNYKTNYTDNNKMKEDGSFYKMFAYFFLLISQLKFDITNIALSPKIIARMLINDYDDNEEFQIGLMNAVNSLVEELNLNSKFNINGESTNN